MTGFQFSSEEALKLRDSPREWYRYAIESIPLPAAFREGAKALRASVRDLRRESESPEGPLSDLYQLACLRDLVTGMEASLRGGFYDEQVPPSLWRKARFPYQEIGHEKLDLLGPTDRKWIEEAWGVPSTHRNVAGVVPDLEAALTAHFVAAEQREKERHEKRLADVREMFLENTSSKVDTPKKSGCAGVIVAVGAISGLLYLWGA